MKKIFGCTITTVGPIYQLNNQRGPIKNILLTDEQIVNLVEEGIEIIVRRGESEEDVAKMNQLINSIILSKQKNNAKQTKFTNPQAVRIENIINASKETEKIVENAKKNAIVEERTDIPVNEKLDVNKLNNLQNNEKITVNDKLVEQDTTGIDYSEDLNNFSNNFDEINGEPIHDDVVIKKEKNNKRR